MWWLLFLWVPLIAASDLESRVVSLELQLAQVLKELKAATQTIAELKSRIEDPTNPLHTRENFSNPSPIVPPLDSSVIWTRQHNEDGSAGTHEMLSLIYNETGSHAFPWPVYIQLSTVHEHGDACGTYVRMLKNDGDGWAAAYHTDLMNGPNAGGVNIGANIEVTNPSPKLRAIGVNIQQESTYADAAINVQNNDQNPTGPWTYGLHFDVNSHGKKAIQVDGNWSAGLDVGNNDILMNANTRLVLSANHAPQQQQVALRFNSVLKQLEILSGETLVAYLPVDPSQPPIRL